MNCYLCESTEELRPYGPQGEMVCFECAMKPENYDTTCAMFDKQLSASGPIVIIGEECGPRPYKPGNY